MCSPLWAAALGGHVIDGCLVSIPFVILFIAALVAASRPECANDVGGCIRDSRWISGRWSVLLVVGLPTVYWAAWDSLGTSPGRWLVGIKVVTETGAAPGLARGSRRALVSVLASGKLLCLGYLWAIGDRERRTWHDHAAGTWVVRK